MIFYYLLILSFYLAFKQLHTHEIVEVCAKILYQVELQRSTLEQMWGFSVEAELIENADRQDELCCYVSRVEDKSVALQNGMENNFFHHLITFCFNEKKNYFLACFPKKKQVLLRETKLLLSMVPLCPIWI